MIQLISCAEHRERAGTEPSSLAAEEPQSQPADEQAAAETAAEPQERAVSVTVQIEDQVFSLASQLWAKGLALAESGDAELARATLDEALNVILGSGLALEAHPKLQELFTQISAEAILVDEVLAWSDNERSERTLAEDLEGEKPSSETGESEAAPAEVTYDLPVVMNNKVQYFIERFQGERREAFVEGMQRSGRYLQMFKRILSEEGVPTDLAYMPQIESTYKVRAYSRARAKGIWQFMSWTARRYGLRINWWIDERVDPEKSCRAAARYLRDLHAQLGDWLLAMAAYNGGPGRVSTAVRALRSRDFWRLSSSTRYLRRETRNFVPAIMAAIIIMKQPGQYGFGDVEPEQPLQYDRARIDSPTDLNIAAELAGVSVQTLQELNPALRRLITPADYEGFELRLPAGTAAAFEQRYAALPASKRIRYTQYVVRRGDTLSRIAQRHGASVAAIQQANSIANPHRLSPGQQLVIPLSQVAPPEGGSYERADVARGTRLTHVVRRGENLYVIARTYGTTIGSIAQWNGIDPRRHIHPGDRLTIIAGTRVGGSYSSAAGGRRIVYSVRRGDTLYAIARRYNTSVSNLRRWNNISGSRILPGDRLTIYVSGGEDASN